MKTINLHQPNALITDLNKELWIHVKALVKPPPYPMNSKFLLFFWFFIFALIQYKASAQTEVTIYGKIVDFNHKALPLNAVALVKVANNESKLIKEETSDSLGKFRFTLSRVELSAGNYQVIILLNHDADKNKSYKNFLVVDTVSSYDLGEIVDNAAAVALDEVKILAARPLYTRKLDKLVVNVDNSILSTGNTLSDLLVKLPGIKIDQSGAITVNGKQGVQITIDGKGEYVTNEQIQVLLSTIRSESIKQLEIIANPSAKYDANQGSVINIITKKNYSQSDIHFTYGSALYPVSNVSALAYPNLNMGTNLNYKQGNFSTNISINYTDDKQFRNYTLENDRFPNINTLKQDSAKAIYYEKKLDTHIGLTYDINKKSFLSAEFLLVKNFQREYDNSNKINFYSISPKPDSSINSQGKYTLNNFYTYTLTLQYSLDLDTSNNKHLDIYYDFSNYHNPSINDVNYTLIQKNTPDNNTYFSSGQLYKVIYNSLKFDYRQNLGKSTQLFVGVKYSHTTSTDTLNTFDVLDLNNNTVLSNGTFDYHESIFGEYAMLNQTAGIFQGQIGLRDEYTDSYGILNDGNPIEQQKYNNLFPSVNILSTLNDNNKITLSYNRRIVRVGFNTLNPILNYSTPFVSVKGNPDLQPLFINYFEIDYQYKDLYLSANYSSSTNSRLDIPIATQNASSITSVFENVKDVKATELDAEYPWSITKWWSTINDATVSNSISYLIGGNQSFWSYNLSSNQHFILGKTISMDLAVNYYSKTRSYYSTINNIFSSDIGLRKSLFAKRLDLTVNCTDILGTSKYYSHNVYPSETSTFQTLKNNRFVNIGLKYNFNTGAAFSRQNSQSKGDFGEKRF
ncbi:outer membrane beta-barrel protein [Mucilaginibacter sp. X5P1]|uniref:outer membrane beta-barrel family protein n=1 Tax=Mucilaginibacter sp. X5P1 TaxID=2723088 RepID=UPI00161B2C05|nr:outer membrane beta-barrel family protein [Mucilaginibacter sp. X5P1]MBB6139311.1 hypothetical protein [Mucilaginibacter sp. X5P1]